MAGPNAKAPGCFLWPFAILWTAVLVPFDYMVLGAVWRQSRTLQYPTTECVITGCGVRSEPNGEGGRTNSLEVIYEFEVDGRRYTGTRYCHGAVSTNTGAWDRVAAGLPVGTRVPAWYNPDDPADAVLRPGLTGLHLMMIWFATPFNVVAAGLWLRVWGRNRPEFDPADRRRVVRTSTGWAARVPGVGRLGVFGIVLGGIAFVGSFVWAFGWGFYPPDAVIVAATILVLGVAGVFAALPPGVWVKVDEVQRTLRTAWALVPFEAVRSVVVEEEVKTDSEGTTRRYRCELVCATEGIEPRVRVTSFECRESAEAFAAWLSERLGLRPS